MWRVQVCDHPLLLGDSDPTGSTSADALAASGKLVVLDKLLRHLHTHDHKVLLLSRHSKVLTSMLASSSMRSSL